MPYEQREDLPDPVRKALRQVPHAQDTYLAAFNSACEQYDSESRAHAVAWAAVKECYEKGEDGLWHPKD